MENIVAVIFPTLILIGISTFLLSILGEFRYKSLAFGFVLIAALSSIGAGFYKGFYLDEIGDISLFLAFAVHFIKNQGRTSLKAAVLTFILIFLPEQLIGFGFNIDFLKFSTETFSIYSFLGLAIPLVPSILVGVIYSKKERTING